MAVSVDNKFPYFLWLCLQYQVWPTDFANGNKRLRFHNCLQRACSLPANNVGQASCLSFLWEFYPSFQSPSPSISYGYLRAQAKPVLVLVIVIDWETSHQRKVREKPMAILVSMNFRGNDRLEACPTALNKSFHKPRIERNVGNFNICDQVLMQLRMAIHHQASDFRPSLLQLRRRLFS